MIQFTDVELMAQRLADAEGRADEAEDRAAVLAEEHFNMGLRLLAAVAERNDYWEALNVIAGPSGFNVEGLVATLTKPGES